MRNSNSIFIPKTRGLELYRRSNLTRRYENNIKIYYKGIRCEDVDRLHLPKDRLQWQAHVKLVMNFRVP